MVCLRNKSVDTLHKGDIENDDDDDDDDDNNNNNTLYSSNAILSIKQTSFTLLSCGLIYALFYLLHSIHSVQRGSDPIRKL
jgi:hypothetical protein